MRTFIKWSGNKSKHLNKFIKDIPDEYDTYIEPFLGSGALLLKLQPKKWIVNDLNNDLINIWKSVADQHLRIIETFKTFSGNFKKLSKENKIKYCKETTLTIPTMSYDFTRASTFLLMKYCAYMGHIVVNNKFIFQGLDGPLYNEKDSYFLSEKYYDNLKSVSKFINDTAGEIHNGDYKNVLKKAKKGDFVFLDPPYIESNNYKFNYNKGENIDDLFVNELLEQVKLLNNKGVKWMMTQADTDQIRTVFKDYTIKQFPVFRAASNTYKNELLIKNY